MKFLKNYQNAWKGNQCDHVFSTLEERKDLVYKKCIKCHYFCEDRVNEY